MTKLDVSFTATLQKSPSPGGWNLRGVAGVG